MLFEKLSGQLSTFYAAENPIVSLLFTAALKSHCASQYIRKALVYDMLLENYPQAILSCMGNRIGSIVIICMDNFSININRFTL